MSRGRVEARWAGRDTFHMLWTKVVDYLDGTGHSQSMGTVKFAAFRGICPLCSRSYGPNARIARTPYGWGHDTCVGAWRAARTALAAAAPRT